MRRGSVEIGRATLAALGRAAARVSRRPDEADDLVQDVLLAAIAAGRDLGDPRFLPWACGAIRLHARFVARSAGRRRRRELADAMPGDGPETASRRFPREFVDALPRSLRVAALLVNLGLTRDELRHLLGVGDAALRRRLSDLRQRWRRSGLRPDEDMASIGASGFDGPRRRIMRDTLSRLGGQGFGVADPDGQAIFFSPVGHVSAHRGN